jgi:hypothetical protein
MADISAFPTLVNVSNFDAPAKTYTAGRKGAVAIKAGMVVGFATHGNTTIEPLDKGNLLETPVGVALHDATVGEKVTVLGNGARAVVANADDTTAVAIGASVILNDNTVGGTVVAATGGVGGTIGVPTPGDGWIIGVAEEAIAGGGSGEITVGIYMVPA